MSTTPYYPLLLLALLLLQHSAAAQRVQLSEYVLRAHGTENRWSFAGNTAEWGENTLGSWAPFSRAQCLPGSTQFGNPFLLRDDGTIFLQLACQNPNMGPYIISVDANSGNLQGASQNNWFPSNTSPSYLFSSDLSYLPNGDIVCAGMLSDETGGVQVFDGNSLKQIWTYATCKGAVQTCGRYGVGSVRDILTSATNDLLFFVYTFGQTWSQYVDVAVNQGIIGQLPNMSGGTGLDYTGQYLFFGENKMIYKTPLPIVAPSTTNTPFPLPSGYTSFTSQLSDTNDNLYILLSFSSAFALASYSSSGHLRWQGHLMTSSFTANYVSTIITDDESLIIYTQAANSANQQALWWSAAFSTETGNMVWNITTSTFQNDTALITCGFDVIPLINETILYQCEYSGSLNPFIYLYPINQVTGRKFEGEVWVMKPDQPAALVYQYDSSSNLYLCGQEGSYPGTTMQMWCMKRYLPNCLYTPHTLDCIYSS